MIYQVFLVIHIISGGTCLLSGLSAMISVKGSSKHVLSGTIFFYSMLIVAITAILLSLVKFNVFLLTIGVFAFFQNYNGRRAICNKSLIPNITDWLVWSIASLNGLYMILTMNTVLTTFGFISLFLSTGLLMRYRKALRGDKISRKDWLSQHIGMMTGAYIATLTAFLVVNVNTFEPWWVTWLAPTIIFVPLIIYWTRKFT